MLRHFSFASETFPMRDPWKLSARFAAFVASVSLMIGCSVTPVAHQSTSPVQTPTPTPSSAPALQGVIHGGQWALKYANVYLLAASQVTPGTGDAGYGDASTSLITSSSNTDGNGWHYVQSGGDGIFHIPSGTWSCTPGQQVYLYSVSGDAMDQSGNANLNAAAGLMALLGECGASNALPTVTGSIQINEITTVAAAYALAGFASDATHISSPATGQGYLGIQNAVKNAKLLADINTGDVPASPPANVTVPSTMIYTIADILSACINSQNTGTGGNNLFQPCNDLMGYETLGSNVPSDTASAAINMAKQPGANVANLYAYVTAYPVWMNYISPNPPTDFAIGVGYSGGGLTSPTAIAIDASGNAWVADTPAPGTAGALIVLDPQGNILSGTGGYLCSPDLGTPSAIALGPSSKTPETAWVLSTSAATVTGVPYGGGSCTAVTSPEAPTTTYPTGWNYPASLAAGNNLYVVDRGLNNLDSFSLGNGSSTTWAAHWQGVFIYPDAVALDGTGNAWVADQAPGVGDSANLYAVNSTGPYTALAGAGFGASPNTIAVGANQSVWVADQGSDKIYPFSTVVTSSSATATAGTPFVDPTGGVGLPLGVAVDGVGNSWTVNENGADIAAFSADGTTALSPDPSANSTYGGYSGNGIVMPSSTSIPTGVAVDPSGDVWLSVQGGTTPVVEFIGMAAPTVTPLADAAAGNKIATRP